MNSIKSINKPFDDSREEKVRYWVDAWNSALKKNDDNILPARMDTVSRWDKMAKQIGRLSTSDRMQSRICRTLKLLEEKSIDLKGLKVLDIGAGAGDFSLAFAQRGARVTAVEPSSAMVSLIEKKINEHNLNNEIEIINGLWEEFNPGENLPADHYDLVFASLNPGVRSFEALARMMDVSCSWCLLCDIASGSKPCSGRLDLWEEILNKTMPENHYNIIYPLNYLYFSGYELQFQNWTEVWGEKQPVEEALIDFLDYFSIYTEITNRVRKIIKTYLQNNSKKGLYTDFHQVRLGMILWKKIF